MAARDQGGGPGRDHREQIAADEVVQIRAKLNLAGDDLDPSDGPPVRLTVSADPPGLLAAGPRSWALDTLPAEVGLATRHGSGTLTFDLRAASCQGDECRLHSRRIEVPVQLIAGATTSLEI